MPNIELTVTEDSPIELNVLGDTPVLLGVQEQIEPVYNDLSPELKQAFLQLAEHIAYIDADGQDYYDALYDALYPVSISSITAVYTQGGYIYTDDTLDDLKADLVVTANYSDGTSETVSTYTLSGSLTAGTSTITVTYLDKTTAFDVTVTAPLYSIPDFAEQSLTSGGKTGKLKKVNGVYYYTGRYTDVFYVYPDGTVHNSKSNTLWFATPADKPIDWEIYDIDWNNPNSMTIDLACKFSKSDSNGNVVTASYTMAANSSGTDAEAEYTNAAYPARNLSALGVQTYHSGSDHSQDVTVSFRVKLFCDGVRYL